MPEVFILSHLHTFEDGSSDWKLLGVFTDRDLARSALESARARPGFRDAQAGFTIDRHAVQGSAPNSPSPDAVPDVVHLAFRVGDHPDTGEEISVIGVYRSEEAARAGTETAPALADWESIEIHPHDLDAESWLEGYASVE